MGTCREIKPSQYQSAGYSANFKSHYGIPTQYWTDFYRLMSTATEYGVSPRPDNLRRFIAMRFLLFTKSVDNTLKQKGRSDSPVWRDAMEALWAKTAVRLFDEEVKEMGDEVSGSERTRRRMQLDLRHVLRQRFFPSGKVEKYWTEKAEKYGGSDYDILKKENSHAEPDGEMDLAVPEKGEEDMDVDFLGKLLGELQVQTEKKKKPSTEEIDAEGAMKEALRRMPKTSSLLR
ncbi:hypothetical protein VTL71DRAFT_288 [Oculimacula yallundae]|uniref:Uncharacterized protein n=1 Tax=Oculimacula yallundae TaxID=86028 RepID=A0ABR4CZT2_9HELO